MEGPKQNFRVRARLEVFFTGAAMQVSGNMLACACADEVKVGCVHGAFIPTFQNAICTAPPNSPSQHAKRVCAQLVDLASGAVVKTIAGVSADAL